MDLSWRYLKPENPPQYIASRCGSKDNTFTGPVVAKGPTFYRLNSGEPVIKESDTEFSCPSAGLKLVSEEPEDSE